MWLRCEGNAGAPGEADEMTGQSASPFILFMPKARSIASVTCVGRQPFRAVTASDFRPDTVMP